MTTHPATPDDSDSLRPWAQAIAHARIPAALKLLLLALFAAFRTANAPRRMLRLPRQDWFISAHCNPDEDHDGPQDWYELRALRRARAELGWLLRGFPNRGMSRLGYRAPLIPPPQAARAPP